MLCVIIRIISAYVVGAHQNRLAMSNRNIIEQSHEIMVLLVLHKLIFQMRMHSHPVGLDVNF